MKDLASKAASKFRRYKYTVGNSADLLYPAAGILHIIDFKKNNSAQTGTLSKLMEFIGIEGGSDDWAKSIGIKYSYTVELADTGNHGFVLPASFIRPVCEDFFPALEVFVDKVASIKV